MAVIGIDLGTTNSACSAWINGELVNIPNRLGHFLTPSVVGLSDNNNLLVGEIAKNNSITHPERNVAMFKRLMGTGHKVLLAKKSFAITELSSIIIRSLIEDAEHALGTKVSEAVISVPAYFNENQRYATKLAGELCGIKVRRLINEPTAAAMAYGLHDQREGTFMVLDMGGGTFDVSILEYFEGVMEVHASAGDNNLGGEDLVDAMVDAAFAQLDKRKEAFSEADIQHICMQMETLKRRISEVKEETLTMTLGQERYSLKVSQDWFLHVVTPLLLRVRKPIEQALIDAQMLSSQIDEIILVGGATRLSYFQHLVANLLGKMPVCHLNPDLVVAIGCGVQAGLIDKNQALDDIVLTDVCPFSLGTEINDEHGQPGYFMPIIRRNSPVPISALGSVVTSEDKQTLLSIKVYQGESNWVVNNVYLGVLNVKVPKSKRGQQTVDIRYSYDFNGLLAVEVTVLSTQKKSLLIIENAPGMLSAKERQQSMARIGSFKLNPRDDEYSHALLAKGERLYSSLLGDERVQVAAWLRHFEQVLQAGNTLEIKRAQAALDKSLATLDKQEWY